MKHQGLRPGAAFIFGGKKAVEEKPAETPIRKLEAKPFVPTVTVKKEPTHMELADEMEALIDEAYESLKEIQDSAGIDVVISTVLSGFKDMYYKIVNKDNQYTAESLFDIELVSQSFMAISHVIKIVMYRRSLATRYNTMLRTNCKFAFSAVDMAGSAEELSFVTVIDYLIDKFVDKDTSK